MLVSTGGVEVETHDRKRRQLDGLIDHAAAASADFSAALALLIAGGVESS
jgi:hypothetical protein